VDAKPDMSPACHQATKSYRVPRCTEPGFIPALLDICKTEGVRLLVPTIDPELTILAASKPLFSELGVRVAVSSPAVVALARDKLATARFLERNDLPAPRTSPLAELLEQPGAWHWPLVVKPIHGSCSVGVRVVRTPQDLLASELDRSAQDYVAQELWRGREYTVNVFFDHHGNLRAAVPHLRYEVRAGEVSKGITERHPTLMDLAGRLGRVLEGASGALCFQAIVTPAGPAAIFEINARFGGGYPLAHRAGATFGRWLLEETLGRPCTAHNDWKPGCVMLRYDSSVFVVNE
jgi:carbamoyl-phosphate synthase large subunit